MEDVIKKYSVSSVLQKDVKKYGKKHLFDGNEETCWSSDEGSPQWIRVSFKKDVLLESVLFQFQGGFAGSNCEIEVGDKIVRTFIPENTNAIQEVTLSPPAAVSESEPVTIIFCKSTDFFGRIILYRLGFGIFDKE
ncbi:nuclear receptor 2C2-associated protein [Rhodnius prolixus]|uniref:nuclear receptor 2C2-associated protein n=1 Tax=Rhodnius prolixus TaxID=13249 RepID=UPI003D18EDBF